jgi:hypothetical protein
MTLPNLIEMEIKKFEVPWKAAKQILTHRVVVVNRAIGNSEVRR